MLAEAGADGRDCRDVLRAIDAPNIDRAVVADLLGGDGLGDEFRQLDDDQGDDATTGGTADDLRRLADDCERAARGLQVDADNPAEVLRERGYGGDVDSGQLDPATWGARKAASAAAARAYAEQLRKEADSHTDGQVDPARIAEAKRVAQAAALGGILTDSREFVGRDPWASEEVRAAERAEAERVAEEIEATGMFEHVAEEGQVPFWQLRKPEPVAEQEPASTDRAWPRVTEVEAAHTNAIPTALEWLREERAERKRARREDDMADGL
ncbi:hypothetical protein GA0070616_0034 [Micromonospora nigra]|uniref:Uncharacterized protein n=1 Tax=Micromonospora nigra TaxID=145857 RepID=A0A1C6R7I3_9ACTN|nr:hypothetical protein [Micromonospora nigra]SCL12828.1 hypothetical protein GA0070616_0034 [Micromonospora nigra]